MTMSISHSIVVVLISAVVLMSGNSAAHGPPAHENTVTGHTCRGLPCPKFTMLNKLADDIEERQYELSKLPSYKATQCLSFKAAQSQGYLPLSMYTRSGKNAEKRRLSSGVPVITEVKHVDDVEPKCSWIYTTYFYVAEDGTLPQPSDTNVTIQYLPERHFYVHSFGGYLGQPEERVLALRVRLNSRKLCYDPSTYFIAAYASPMVHINRKTEIWLPVRPCESAVGGHTEFRTETRSDEVVTTPSH